jgi:hypothetical protein
MFLIYKTNIFLKKYFIFNLIKNCNYFVLINVSLELFLNIKNSVNEDNNFIFIVLSSKILKLFSFFNFVTLGNFIGVAFNNMKLFIYYLKKIKIFYIILYLIINNKFIYYFSKFLNLFLISNIFDILFFYFFKFHLICFYFITRMQLFKYCIDLK